jgi:hypothetical protein
MPLFTEYVYHHGPELRYPGNETPGLFIKENIKRICLRRGYNLTCQNKDFYCIIGLSVIQFTT